MTSIRTALLRLLVLLLSIGISVPLLPSHTRPATAAETDSQLGGGLPGFDSPYIGHTGANDGQGGQFAGSWQGKLHELEMEREMGLKWTFLPVHWSLIEGEKPTAPPPAPVAPETETDGGWSGLDRFVRAARDNGLNVFLQIVVGGNAGGPPAWAGRRAEGRSAPRFMDGTEPGANGQGLVPFAEKLATRYAPGGTLAQADGWTDGYGVRAWVMDNEPDSYQTNWDTVGDDYAEFVVKAAAKIKALDPQAVIVAPETAEGNREMRFTTSVLQSGIQQASQTYRNNGINYVAGPSIDVVSFHSYELLGLVFSNAMFDGDDLAAQQVLKNFRNIRTKFAQFEDQAGFEYAPKTEFWHTEGGFGFIADDPEGKKNWIIQWLTRGFEAGITKMTIFDASPDEQQSVKTYTRLLPNPVGAIEDVTTEVGANPNEVGVFRATRPDGGWTYIAWANSGFGNVFTQSVTLPVRSTNPTQVSRTGAETPLNATNEKVTIQLRNLGVPFNEPVFVVDGAPADTTAPAAPVITSPAEGSTTASSSVSVEGSSEPGSRVDVADGGVPVGSATADATGAWSFDSTFADGTHSLVATATDAAGNTSEGSATRTFTVDTSAPAPPTITSPAEGSKSKSSWVAIAGAAEPQSIVEVWEGTSLIGSAKTDGSGTWSLAHFFADGTHTITATATDAAGNQSVPSAERTFRVKAA